jgi:hypothetical protein
VPTADFDVWWREKNGGQQRTSGTRAIDWPGELVPRVGLQLSACRGLAAKKLDIVPFALHHYRVGRDNSIANAFRKLGTDLVQPMLRDLQRLASQRTLSFDLGEVVRSRPRSDDAALDALLAEACDAIREVAPSAHQRAIEKLWDARERAKTLRHADKKTSATLMLDAVSDEPQFRALLESDAKALTDIGNTFRIRHHEVNRPAIETKAQVDYLFHRLMVMLSLVLR